VPQDDAEFCQSVMIEKTYKNPGTAEEEKEKTTKMNEKMQNEFEERAPESSWLP